MTPPRSPVERLRFRNDTRARLNAKEWNARDPPGFSTASLEMLSSVQIDQLKPENHENGFAIAQPSPRLSWRFRSTNVKGWRQTHYEIKIVRQEREELYRVESSQSVYVPWPSKPLQSREIAHVQVRATGNDGSVTDWASVSVEVSLLNRNDWTAKLISGPPPSEPSRPKKPIILRRKFHCHAHEGIVRLYASAHGIYHIEINGVAVGDQVLSPGWQSYHRRLHYQTYDVSQLLKPGDNVIGVYVGEGWYAGRLGRPGTSNIWGSRMAFLGQLEVDGQPLVTTDSSWEYLYGPVVESEIYNGETFDTNLHDPHWSTVPSISTSLGPAEELPFPSAELISPDAPPVRRVMEMRPKELIITPEGKKVLDFGQNLVGWLRIEKDIPCKGELLVRHAEVMEHGELGTRPLRTAKAQLSIKLGGSSIKGFEPKFTWYGFR